MLEYWIYEAAVAVPALIADGGDEDVQVCMRPPVYAKSGLALYECPAHQFTA